MPPFALTLAAPRLPDLPSVQGLPGLCGVCRRWSSARVCADCRMRFALPRPRCTACAAPLHAGSAAPVRCLPCASRPASERPVQRTVAAVDYGFPWDGLVTAFKFGGRDDLAPMLAEVLGSAVAAAMQTDPGPPADLVVPIPLSERRLRHRGFNQAWELARRVGKDLRLPTQAHLLTRVRDTEAQSALSAEDRRRNLRGAFWVAPAEEDTVAGRAVALVDDVLTTGSTAEEAARTLIEAGAASVQLWVFARTPAPVEA